MEKKGAADKHEELIDVLTKEGTPTGEVKTRKDIHEQGLWHRIVHVWCVDAQSGELILQQRAADKMTNPNKWDVSAAGHVGHGESSLATAQIELKEELGLVVPPEQFRFLGSTPCSVTYHNGTYIDNEWQDLYLVELNEHVPISALTLQKEEVAGAKYLHYKEVERHYAEGDEAFVPHNDIEPLFAALHQRFP